MKTKTLYTFLSLLSAMLLFVSCGEDRTHEYIEKTEENQWIYSKMKDVYLWGNTMAKPDRSSFFTTTSKFFTSLLARNDKVSFFTDSVPVYNYGLKFSLMRDPLGEAMSQYYALALHVEPGSPADSAGIKRGTWISALNGKALNSSSGKLLQSGTATKVATAVIDYDDENGKYFWVNGDTLSMPQACSVESSAVYLDSIYNVRTYKVGYIVLRSMSGSAFTEEIPEILLGFAAEDVSDVIIDLRYCNEGTIDNAAVMAGAFVPATLAGKPFATLKGREEVVDTIYNFAAPVVNLSDKRLFLITGKDTKGAAELFVESVNVSRDMHDVMIVGTNSSGANVFTRKYTSPYGFSINPAVATMFSSADIELATTGIIPDFPIDELEEGKIVYPLGNRREYILRNLEYFIVNDSLPSGL